MRDLFPFLKRLGLGAAFSIIVLVIVIALASVFVRYLDSLGKRQGKVA